MLPRTTKMKAVAANKTPVRLSESQRAALVTLLADEDSAVHEIVRAKLISFGPNVVEWLRPHTVSNDPLLRRRAQEIIRHFGRKSADARFTSKNARWSGANARLSLSELRLKFTASSLPTERLTPNSSKFRTAQSVPASRLLRR